MLYPSQMIREHVDDDDDDDDDEGITVIILIINGDILGCLYILFCSLSNFLDFVKPFLRSIRIVHLP